MSVKTIIVAEDEPMMLKTLEFKLKKDGYRVMTAPDGKVAKSLIDSNKPDLVLTDLLMPFVTGIELVEHIRENHKSKYIPVIILSSMGQENTIIRALEVGADDFISKPFSPNELSLRVERALHIGELKNGRK